MGKVIAIVRLLPEDAEVDEKDLESRVKRELPADTYEVLKSQSEPLAFGISALYLWIVMPEDIAGGTDDLEKRLTAIRGVGQVDIVSVSRMIG